MNRIAHGVVVEKTSQGCRVEGYLDNERVITITNCNIRRIFEVSHSKGLVGSFENAKAINDIMCEVIKVVEDLRKEHEGRVTISVVKQGDNWAVLVDGSNESPESKSNKEEAVSMAKFFKESYEKRGVIVKYDEE